MRTRRLRPNHPLIVVAALGVGLGLSALGVSFFIWAPALGALWLAAMALFFGVRSPRSLALLALAFVLGMGVGFVLVAPLALLLRYLPVWVTWLLALAVIGFELERYRRRRARRHA